MSPTKGVYGTFVHSVAELPKGEHWALLEFGSVTIPGDERSRQAPGHGYPEHSESTLSYEAFTTEAEMREVLERRANGYSRDRYIAIHVTETFGVKVVSVVQSHRQ